MTGYNKHHRPVTVPEHTGKGFHIDLTGLCRNTGVRVNPDPSKLFRVPTRINLVVKEVRYRSIIKGDRHISTSLLDQDNVSYEPRISWRGDPKAADLRRPLVTQVDQFGPGIGAEPERSTFALLRTFPTGSL